MKFATRKSVLTFSRVSIDPKNLSQMQTVADLPIVGQPIYIRGPRPCLSLLRYEWWALAFGFLRRWGCQTPTCTVTILYIMCEINFGDRTLKANCLLWHGNLIKPISDFTSGIWKLDKNALTDVAWPKIMRSTFALFFSDQRVYIKTSLKKCFRKDHPSYEWTRYSSEIDSFVQIDQTLGPKIF